MDSNEVCPRAHCVGSCVAANRRRQRRQGRHEKSLHRSARSTRPVWLAGWSLVPIGGRTDSNGNSGRSPGSGCCCRNHIRVPRPMASLADRSIVRAAAGHCRRHWQPGGGLKIAPAGSRFSRDPTGAHLLALPANMWAFAGRQWRRLAIGPLARRPRRA